MPDRTPLAALGLASSALLTLTACGGASDASPSSGSTASDDIAVAATDTACDVATTQLRAGAHRFSVTNKGSKVTEFYVYARGDRVVGEVENIAPGVRRTLIVDLSAGSYEAACKPGMVGDGLRRPLTVTGATGASNDDQELTSAVAEYEKYVRDQVAILQDQTAQFTAAVKAGDVAKAQQLYPVARTSYERIEPVAESFGDLDPKIDARENDVEPGTEWTGFHVLEKTLWTGGDLTAAGPIADRLDQDVDELAGKVASLGLLPLDLVQLLKDWTAAARRMTAGRAAGAGGAVPPNGYLPPEDTGEAIGLPPSGLTLTVGFGPTLFTTADGRDRFGLAARRPAALTALPAFPGDDLDPAISGSDLCVQACANDPQVAVHAVRNLARIGQGLVSVRWSQLGFGRPSSTSTGQTTPRNLFGMKDGTDNLKSENAAALEKFVWVAHGDGPDWHTGGSYLVARRIRMEIEAWDRQPLREQEQTIGRTKGTGAPLGQQAEFDPVGFTERTDGAAALPRNSHVFLAHPTQAKTAILRRGYSFADGTDGLGRLDAGLFFIAFQRDPATGFVQIQKQLQHDRLNEYIVHTSSAVFACPPGVQGDGDWWGRALFY